MLTITFFSLEKNNLFNIEQRLLQKLLYFNITKYIKELMFLGFEYSFYYPLILTLENTKNYFYTAPLLRFNELLKLNYNIKEFNIYYSVSKKTNLYFHLLNLINSFNTINAFSNSLHIMSNTGAKANWNQICQLIGVRGYLENATGEIFKIPILNGFNKGLNFFEYFISCYGARKGILDTALKTADAGYLTRKLVESTQELTIKEYNCGSNNSFEYYLEQINFKGNIILPFFLLLSGKVLQKNLIEHKTKKIIEFKYNYIIDNLLKKIYFLKHNFLIKINTFSIKTCLAGRTICSTCFGQTNFNINNIGKSVGVLSGQVIGEPGTQLTLRTFHTGGANLNLNIKTNNDYITKYKNSYLFQVNKYKLCAKYNNILKKNNNKIFSFIYIKKNYFILNYSYLLFVLKKYKFNQIISINNKLIYSKNNIHLSNLLLTYLNINNISQRKSLININFEQNYTGEFIYKNVLQLIIKNKYHKWIILNLNTSILFNQYFSTNYKIIKEKILFIKSKNQRFIKLFLIKNKNFLYSYREIKNKFSYLKKLYILNIFFSINYFLYYKQYINITNNYKKKKISQIFRLNTHLLKYKKTIIN